MPRPVVELSSFAYDAICFAAVETYPKECFGFLIGEYTKRLWFVHWATPAQIAQRKPKSVVTRSDEKAAKYFGAAMVGTFHSHPEEPPTASDTDKADMSMPEVQIITSIYKSGASWRFRVSAYTANDFDGIIRRSKIVIR